MASDDTRMTEIEVDLDLVKSEPELDSIQPNLESNPDGNETEEYGDTHLETSKECRDTEKLSANYFYDNSEISMDHLYMPKQEVFSDEFDDSGLPSTSNLVGSDRSPNANDEEIKQEFEYDEQLESLQEEVMVKMEKDDDGSYQDKYADSELMTDDSEPDLCNIKEEMCPEDLVEEITPSTLSLRPTLELFRDGFATVIRTGEGASLDITPMCIAEAEGAIFPTVHQPPIHITSGIMAGNSEGEIITDTPRIDMDVIKNMLPEVDINSLLQPRFIESVVDRVIQHEDGNIKYSCDRCSNTYKLKLSLHKHMKVHDTLDRRLARSKILKKVDRKTYKCAYCKKKYLYITSLNTHESFCDKRIVEVKPVKQIKDYKCSCGQKYVRKSRLEACIRLHANPYACRNCSDICLTRAEYTQHRKDKHTKPKFVPKTKQYPCKLCPAMFVERKLLWKHLKKHQRIQIEEIERLSLAKKVEEDEETIEEQDKQVNCNEGQVNCDEERMNHEQKLLNCYEEPEIHNEEQVNCDQEILNKDLHPKDCYEKKSDGKNVLILNCFSCSESFSSQYDKSIHEQKVHNSQEDSNAETSRKFRFICQLCTESFLTLGALSNHKMVSHNEASSSESKMFEKMTEDCVKSETRTKSSNIETTNYELMCVHCRKFCASTESLTSHLRFHSSERKFPCQFCGFRFSTLVKKKNHELLHKGELKYVCFICEYRCSSPGRLKLHKNSQRHKDTRVSLNKLKESACNSMTVIFESESFCANEETIKPVQNMVEGFPCDVCELVFSDEEKMSEHKFATHPFIEFPNDTSERIFFK